MIFCKHDWKVISETVTESQFEHATKQIRMMGHTTTMRIPHQMCDADRKHIVICSCSKCGKLKQFVTNI